MVNRSVTIILTAILLLMHLYIVGLYNLINLYSVIFFRSFIVSAFRFVEFTDVTIVHRLGLSNLKANSRPVYFIDG